MEPLLSVLPFGQDFFCQLHSFGLLFQIVVMWTSLQQGTASAVSIIPLSTAVPVSKTRLSLRRIDLLREEIF
jgi:hypothetical protein